VRADGLSQVLTLLVLFFSDWLTGYHAWLNVKPLFLLIFFPFSVIFQLLPSQGCPCTLLAYLSDLLEGKVFL